MVVTPGGLADRTEMTGWDEAHQLARVNGVIADVEGFPRLLGIRFVEAKPERLVAEMEWRPDLTMVYGVLHGGATAGFADTVAGVATWMRLQPGQFFQTIDFQATYVRGCRSGRIRAAAVPVHVGRRIHVWAVEVRDDQDRLLAQSKVTQLVLEEGI